MEEGASGCLGIFIVIADIAVVIGSGILAWNWIAPDNFGRGILFAIVWGLISSAGYGLVQLLFVGLISLFRD